MNGFSWTVDHLLSLRLASPAKPITLVPRRQSVPGSGIGTTAMSTGLLNPEIRVEFTVAPEVVYSPIVPLVGS
jgi:hypothetical protein